MKSRMIAKKQNQVRIYEIRPRVDGSGCNLISDVLPFGRLWYTGPNGIASAIKFAKFYSRSHDTVIRVYDEADNVVDRHAHLGSARVTRSPAPVVVQARGHLLARRVAQLVGLARHAAFRLSYKIGQSAFLFKRRGNPRLRGVDLPRATDDRSGGGVER